MIVAILLIPVLLWLGVWQLQRADEKQQLLDRWNNAPVGLTELPERGVDEAAAVNVSGRFMKGVIYLLDNRTRQGRPGYEVVVPFRLNKNSRGETPLVLINLGWIAAGQYRDQLPEIDLPSGIHQITGRLVTPSPIMQLTPDSWSVSGRIRVQQLDMVRLAARHPGLYPAVIRSERALMSNLSVGWPVVNMPPERHIGYAIQWFGLAIVLLVGSGWLMWHRKREGI